MPWGNVKTTQYGTCGAIMPVPVVQWGRVPRLRSSAGAGEEAVEEVALEGLVHGRVRELAEQVDARVHLIENAVINHSVHLVALVRDRVVALHHRLHLFVLFDRLHDPLDLNLVIVREVESERLVQRRDDVGEEVNVRFAGTSGNGGRDRGCCTARLLQPDVALEGLLDAEGVEVHRVHDFEG